MTGNDAILTTGNKKMPPIVLLTIMAEAEERDWLQGLSEEEYWFNGTAPEIKKYLADKITAVFQPFTAATFDNAEIPEANAANFYDFVQDQIDKQVDDEMKDGVDKLRHLYEVTEHARALTPEQRTEALDYFKTFFKTHLLFFLSCFSFERATMTLGLLQKCGFGEKEWERNVFQHCLATIVGWRGMRMGRDRWSEDSEDGVGMAKYARKLMKEMDVTADCLESLIPKVATSNGLFALSDEDISRFNELGIDMRTFKGSAQNSEKIFRYFFPDQKGAGERQRKVQLKGRCRFIYNAARTVLEKCKDTPLHFLFQDVLMGTFNDDAVCYSFPGMSASPLQRLESLKLCSEREFERCAEPKYRHKARLFADNWGKSVPASDERKQCMFCELKLEQAPGPRTNLKFYPVIQNREGFTELRTSYDEKEKEILDLVSQLLKNVNTLDETENLGPVELCLLRLLVYVGISDKDGKVNQFQEFTETLNNDMKSSKISRSEFYAYQILVILTVLGTMLFPYVPIDVSISSVELFVVAVFGELARRLDCVGKLNLEDEQLSKVSNLALVEMMFGKAVATIIPSVFENLATIRMNVMGEDRRSLITTRDPNNTVIWPLSTRHHLVPFLISPSLRKQYPVLYQYLHLSGQFSHVTLIDKIAPFLRKIRDFIMQAVSDSNWSVNWDEDKLSDVADRLSTQGQEAFQETLKGFDKNSNWLWQAISATLNSVISDTCRSALRPFFEVQTNGLSLGDLPLRCFVPDQSDSWIFLQVLEGLSRSHNTFVRVLQTQVGIETSVIEDITMSAEAEREHMDLTVFGNMLIDCISGKISRSGIALFDREIEQNFAKVLSNQRYAIIVHTSLQASVLVRLSAAASDLVTHFEQVVRPRPLSWEQKYQLLKHAGRLSTNVSNMCERLMIKAMTLSRYGNKRACAGGQTIVEFIADQASELSEFDKEGYFAFSKARNATQDSFVVAQLSRIYSLMKRTSDMGGADSIDTVDDCIVASLKGKYLFKEPPAKGFELRGNWDAICSLIPKMALALEDKWRLKADDFFSMGLESIVQEFEARTRTPDHRLFLSADEHEVLETMKGLRGPTGGHLFVFYDEARAKH